MKVVTALLLLGAALRVSGVSSLSALSGVSGPDEKSTSILRGVVNDELRNADAGFTDGV